MLVCLEDMSTILDVVFMSTKMSLYCTLCLKFCILVSWLYKLSYIIENELFSLQNLQLHFCTLASLKPSLMQLFTAIKPYFFTRGFGC
ncbi:hypothetical protein VNO77_39106 [Canavalia gladiata]|uniref:Uncharacterized protein n=1 Tax=Canavalia gladiata TaxID=3824 RepID=A0AAN9KCK8_CANGL